jgi:hypothetical protein
MQDNLNPKRKIARADLIKILRIVADAAYGGPR